MDRAGAGSASGLVSSAREGHKAGSEKSKKSQTDDVELVERREFNDAAGQRKCSKVGKQCGCDKEEKMLGGVRRVRSSGCYRQIAHDDTIIIACLVTKFK